MFRILFLLLVICNSAAADEILVPIRNIKRGEIVSQEDFSLETVEKAGKNHLKELNGNNMKAGKNLAQGKPINKNDLYFDSAVIHKGDVVTARFIRKNMVIEFQATALSNGNLNEIIKIKNIDTNKILTGKVMEDGTILIS